MGPNLTKKRKWGKSFGRKSKRRRESQFNEGRKVGGRNAQRV